MNSNTLFDLLNEIVRNNSSKSAVVFQEEVISYGELNERSDCFAKEIINRGIKPGSMIGLAIHNSIDLIPLIVAIWKANCVYFPIDPNYPSRRIEMMLKSTRPELLISEKEILNKFSFFKGQIYCVHEEEEVPDIEVRKPKSDDLAYMIYTSGSTGEPKGIIVDHSALKHSAVAYNELHPEKTTALVAGSISFDPSLLTIVSTLAKGGTLCLYDNHDGIDVSRAEDIVKLIERNSVNFILSTPSFYSKLLQQQVTLPSLRNVDLCGEDISESFVETHSEISPNAVLYNVYGPTEYAMGVTARIVYDPQEKKQFQITIGKSFSCNQIFILDADLNPVKVGEKGEIFVGGPGLAKGYFQQKNLTEEKFILVDHLESPPIKLYRTGDMGYFLPNGEIVFAGRKDLQIKINGHRVELEEVEKVISKYQQVEKAVVLVGKENSNQLIAFFKGRKEISLKQLKGYLHEELPMYMIPSKWIRVTDWPLTNNGKIDKEALARTL